MKRTVVTTTTTTLQTRAYQQRAIRGGVGEGLRRSRGDLGVVADSYVDCHGFDHHTRNDISPAAGSGLRDSWFRVHSCQFPSESTQSWELISRLCIALVSIQLCIFAVYRLALQACKRPGGGWTQSVQDQVGLVSAQNDARVLPVTRAGLKG